MMQTHARGVILVGHGGIPKDCPRDLVMKLKRLEGQRREAGHPPSVEEMELDRKIRRWPRNAETDPYQAGLEALAAELRPFLDGALFEVAYNEYCAPTLEETVEHLAQQGATEITVITTMVTPGGSHSEIEIPESLDRLRTQFPAVTLRYASPFDLNVVATMLAKQVARGSR
jgi:sirohydrochlorin cobaltochelatase